MKWTLTVCNTEKQNSEITSLMKNLVIILCFHIIAAVFLAKLKPFQWKADNSLTA